MNTHSYNPEFKKVFNICKNCDKIFGEKDYEEFMEFCINNYLKSQNKFLNDSINNSEIIFKSIFSSEINYDALDNIPIEECVIDYYKQKGFNAFFAENTYWIILFFMIYYYKEFITHFSADKTFINNVHVHGWARNKLADFDEGVIDNIPCLPYHIIMTFFSNITHFSELNYLPCSIDNCLGNVFTMNELLSPIYHLKKEQLKLIFRRMTSDFKYYKRGLPDLIVFDDEEFFFVEVKSKKDMPSLKQIMWHKFLSEEVNIKVVLFLVDKSQKQVDNIKKQYLELNDFNRYDNNDIGQMTHLNEILLIPDNIDYINCLYKKITFLTYNIKHSSGKGESKQYVEIIKNNYNYMTGICDYKNENMKFLQMMDSDPYITENTVVNFNKTRLWAEDYGLTDSEFYAMKAKCKDEWIYKKAKELYFPNVFADYRPTKKQIKRNKEAKLLEEQKDYSDAAQLYEKNVSEKTGSPTTYKRLIKIYLKSNDLIRIKEIIDIAIPIFVYLDDKKNTLYFLETKYRLLQSGYGRNRNFAYYKLLTPKKMIIYMIIVLLKMQIS